jgi:hypothetical protein
MADAIIKLDEGWLLDAGHRLDQPPNGTAVIVFPVPATKPKKGNRPMLSDFMPSKRGDRIQWWSNLKKEIPTEGPNLGLTPAEITAVETLATDELAKYAATHAADSALKGARLAEKNSTNEAAIRNQIRYWKTKPNFDSSTAGGKLRLFGPDTGFDSATFKPKLSVSLDGAQAKIDFTKGECDYLCIYTRLRGTTGWTKLGIDSSSPYYDTRPLTNPNVPENREYMAMGVIDDVEIGLQSDIVSIVFG